MWAAGSLEFLHPIRIGDSIRKYSVIEAIEEKKGRSGDLVFVKLRHDVHNPAGLALRETQELVYRDKPGASKALPESAAEDPLPVADWTRTLRPDPILLFRFSAATFNSHRIHYDQSYVREVEGYPDLVVQGPFTASRLFDLATRTAGAPLTAFGFRALAPLFVDQSVRLRPGDKPGSVEAVRCDGAVAMSTTWEA